MTDQAATPFSPRDITSSPRVSMQRPPHLRSLSHPLSRREAQEAFARQEAAENFARMCA